MIPIPGKLTFEIGGTKYELHNSRSEFMLEADGDSILYIMSEDMYVPFSMKVIKEESKNEKL